MKASTAASILRAARGRVEAWGLLQLGKMEILALEFAAQQVKAKDTDTFIRLKELQANGVMGINRITKDMFLALRTGYKTLETLPPTTEFTVATDGEEKTSEGKPPEIHTADKWFEELGINEKDIEDALGNDDTPESP